MTNNIPANPTPQALNANSKIGEILIALGFATQQGVDDTFAYQQAERGKGNNPGLIGELFVQRGVCTAEQRDIGMKVQSLLKRLSRSLKSSSTWIPKRGSARFSSPSGMLPPTRWKRRSPGNLLSVPLDVTLVSSGNSSSSVAFALLSSGTSA